MKKFIFITLTLLFVNICNLSAYDSDDDLLYLSIPDLYQSLYNEGREDMLSYYNLSEEASNKVIERVKTRERVHLPNTIKKYEDIKKEMLVKKEYDEEFINGYVSRNINWDIRTRVRKEIEEEISVVKSLDKDEDKSGSAFYKNNFDMWFWIIICTVFTSFVFAGNLWGGLILVFVFMCIFGIPIGMMSLIFGFIISRKIRSHFNC